MRKILFDRKSEMPPGPVSRSGFVSNLTGSWRYLRPRYEEKLASCIAACPASERIEAWMRLAEGKNYFEAWQLIKAVNPFPRVCGRVCFHPCESECNRGHFDRPIAIHAIERFVSDYGRSMNRSETPKAAKTGRSVGIIGSGPAGLTCAHHLARRGHSVTLYEAETKLGGLLMYGIPSYRLPKDVLDEEIGDIIGLGIDVRTGKRVESIEKLRATHDALFVATGFSKSSRLEIPGEQDAGVIDALEFLRRANTGLQPEMRGKALVIGGGNAAIDTARAALRLGAEPTIMYRRSRVEMPANTSEIEEAEKEGVSIRYLAQPVEIIRENGRPLLVECMLNRLGEPDTTGRRQPEPIAGSTFVMETNAVIVAIGERPDLSLFRDIVHKEHTSREQDAKESPCDHLPDGVFAGGDLTSAQRTVAHAIGSGRRAAIQIDKYLGGEGTDPADYLDAQKVKFEHLNVDYFPHRPRIRLPMLPLRDRATNSKEVNLGIGEDTAISEVERCFHCGVCISCENCYLFCPDIAVRKSSDGTYSIDYDFCKGCGICVHECPRNAMSICEEIRT
ncbi:MAG: FAD-dependent oxidoreductase [Candidatus Lindowbacteria bacterium]|nr:FAD-dependent oxidoreductase [Candidatus Lindowbacteria bacterium]